MWAFGQSYSSSQNIRIHQPQSLNTITSPTKFPWPTVGGLAELWVHNCWQKRIFGPNLPKGVKHDNNLAVFEIVCRISGSFRVDILLRSGRETDVFISQPFWPRCRDPTSQLSKNLPTGKPPTASHYFSLSHLLSPAKLQLNIPPVNLNMVGSTISLDYIHKMTRCTTR